MAEVEDASSFQNSSEVVKEEKLSHEEKLQYANAISRPMASKKLVKRLYKLIKSAFSHKTYLRMGLKGVMGRIRRGERGIVILGGDITPIDIICHVPAVCEEKNIPYIFVPCSTDIGNAIGVRRAMAVVMVRENADYDELYKKCKKEIAALAATVF